MDNYQNEAARIAIEEAAKDPDLHSYTEPAREGQAFIPHRWVVNAIARVLKQRNINLGQAATDVIGEIVDKRMERIDRRITTVVDSVTERLRALEGTGDRTSSPARTSVVDVLNLVRDALVRVTALEDAPRRLNELDARCDALAARIDLLEAGRTGPRKAPIAYLEPSRIQVDQDRVRSMFPPGVADPTTEAIAQRTAELDHARDRIATLEKLLDGRDAHHEATMAKLSDATASFEDIAKACGIQPIGSRQQNTAAILHWLEVHTGASKLAETEWNRLRERVNPIIAAQFSGQDIGDAIVNTVQLLEARVRHAFDEERARCETITARDEDNAALAIKLKDATDRLAELQGKHAGRLRLLEDQQAQVTELRGEVVRLRTIVDETTFSLDAANAPARTPLPMRVDVVLRQLADARKAIAEVWALVAERDGHGSPFYTEPAQHESAAEAVAHVLAHLRNKCTLTLKAHDEQAVELRRAQNAATEQTRRANDLEERAKRIEALHKNQHEQLGDGAKLKAERDEAREHAAMFDIDRCNLRMDLDVAKATIVRMQPLVTTAERLAQAYGGCRSWPPALAELDGVLARVQDVAMAAEVYETACTKAANASLGDDEDDGDGFALAAANEGARIAAESRAEGCGTEGCTDPDCPA